MRPKYIPATKKYRGRIYHYHSHGPSAKMVIKAKKLRADGWLAHVAPAGRPGVSIIYWRRA